MPTFSLLSVYKHDQAGLHCSWVQDCVGTAELAHLRARGTEAVNGGPETGYTVVVVPGLPGVSTLDPMVLVRPADVVPCPPREFAVYAPDGGLLGLGDTENAAHVAAFREAFHSNMGDYLVAAARCQRAPAGHGFVPCVAGRRVAAAVVRETL